MKWFFAIFLTFSIVFLTIFGINCVYGTIFPLKYTEEVEFASDKTGLDSATILSVINVESHFNKNAISPKGAVGLMQVLPTTADEIVKNLNLGDYDLENPQTNIYIGSVYLAQLLNKFKDLKIALCAYNAGPANVKSWLSDEKYSSDGTTLEKIPFAETENYLQKFQKNFKYYSQKIK